MNPTEGTANPIEPESTNSVLSSIKSEGKTTRWEKVRWKFPLICHHDGKLVGNRWEFPIKFLSYRVVFPSIKSVIPRNFKKVI